MPWAELRPSSLLVSCEKGNTVTALAKPESHACPGRSHHRRTCPFTPAQRAGVFTFRSQMKLLSNLSKSLD